MSDTPTPRTDEKYIHVERKVGPQWHLSEMSQFARDLERELAAANAALADAHIEIAGYEEKVEVTGIKLHDAEKLLATRTQTEAALREQVRVLHRELGDMVYAVKRDGAANGHRCSTAIVTAEEALDLTPEIIASELAELRAWKIAAKSAIASLDLSFGKAQSDEVLAAFTELEKMP